MSKIGTPLLITEACCAPREISMRRESGLGRSCDQHLHGGRALGFRGKDQGRQFVFRRDRSAACTFLEQGADEFRPAETGRQHERGHAGLGGEVILQTGRGDILAESLFHGAVQWGIGIRSAIEEELELREISAEERIGEERLRAALGGRRRRMPRKKEAGVSGLARRYCCRECALRPAGPFQRRGFARQNRLDDPPVAGANGVRDQIRLAVTTAAGIARRAGIEQSLQGSDTASATA